MSDNKTVRIGISGDYNAEVISRILANLPVEYAVEYFNNANNLITRDFDSYIFVKPAFSDTSLELLHAKVAQGKNAYVMISLSPPPPRELHKLLESFQVKAQGTKTIKNYKARYTEHYPVIEKRGGSDSAYVAALKKIALLRPLSDSDDIEVLIRYNSLFCKEPLTVKCKKGKGFIVFSDSFMITTDTSELITDVIMHAQLTPTGIGIKGGDPELLRVEFASTINHLFEMYDELPFHVLFKRIDLSKYSPDEIDPYQIIEELVMEGQIECRIRRDCLVKNSIL